jgi:hypothetical protein
VKKIKVEEKRTGGIRHLPILNFYEINKTKEKENGGIKYLPLLNFCEKIKFEEKGNGDSGICPS